jgi:hypothetical protein
MTKIPVYAKLNSDNRPDKLGAYTAAEPIATEYGGTGTNNFSGTVNALAAEQASSVTQNYIDVCSLGSGGATAFSALTDTNITSPITGQVVTWDGTDWTPSTSPAGVTVHNLLVGLSANDHPQYVLSATNTNLSAFATAVSNDVNTHIADTTIHFEQNEIDHGVIIGLGDNDHPQYTLSATNLALSTLVSNIQTSTVNLSSYINANEASWLAGGATDHGALTGLFPDNDHPQYTLSSTNLNLSNAYNAHAASSTVHFTQGQIDHGTVTGLGDNDHPQYVLSATNLALSTLVTAVSSDISTHIADTTIHFEQGDIDHGSITGLGDNDHPQYVLVTTNTNLSSLVNNYIANAALSGLSDTNISTPATGQVLTWNGTDWTPSTSPAGVTDHGLLTGLEDNDHPQYTLSATNLNLSSLVGNIQTSTVDLSAYIAANQAAWSTDTNTTDHGALTGLGDNDHPQYVLVTTNTNLSTTVSDHLASAVHWDLVTLNTNYLNASGDSSNNAFYLSSLSATTMSATNYSGLSLSGSVRDVTIGSPGSNNVLAWNGTAWVASAISFPGGGGGLTEEQVDARVLLSIASGITTSGIDVVNSSPADSVTIGTDVNVLIDRERVTIGDCPVPQPFCFVRIDTSADHRTTAWHSWASGATISLLSSTAPNGDNYFTFDNTNTEKSVTVLNAGIYKIECNFVLGTSSGVSPNVSGAIEINSAIVVSSIFVLNQAAQPVNIGMSTVRSLSANDIIRPRIRSSSASRHYLYPTVSNLYIERKF